VNDQGRERPSGPRRGRSSSAMPPSLSEQSFDARRMTWILGTNAPVWSLSTETRAPQVHSYAHSYISRDQRVSSFRSNLLSSVRFAAMLLHGREHIPCRRSRNLIASTSYDMSASRSFEAKATFDLGTPHQKRACR